MIGFLIEFVVTYVLVLTVYAAAADEENDVKGSPPLAIGLAITIGHLFAVSIITQSQGCIYKKYIFIRTTNNIVTYILHFRVPTQVLV